MKDEMLFCQSCGMPMLQPDHFGTEADGSPNQEYCAYCYKDGNFTADCSMEEMIQFNAQFHDQMHGEDGHPYTREEAIAEMRKFFPMLKRWQE